MSNVTTAAGTFKVSISPGSVTVPSEAGVYHGSATVSDYGSEAVSVQPQTLRLGKSGACSEHGVPWLHIDGARFTLEPGQHHAIAFTVSDTSALTGRGAVVAMASPLKTGGHLRVGGGVGEAVTVGDGHQVCTKPVALPPPYPGGTSPYVYGAIGAAVLVLLFLVALVARKIRRS